MRPGEGNLGRLAVAIAWLAILVATAEAQNLDAESGRAAEGHLASEDSSEEPVMEVGEDSLSPQNGDVVIIPELKSIRLFTDAGESGDDRARAQAQALVDTRVQPGLKRYVGKPLTIAALIELRREAQRIFDRHSSALMRVLIPEQEISSGEVVLVAIAARVGEIEFTSESGQKGWRLSPGVTVDRQILIDDLDWLNRPSFSSASVLLSPGDRPGETDLRVSVPEVEKPWVVFSSWDNHGVDTLGNDRWSFGAAHLDLFDRNIELTYQFLGDSEFDRLRAHLATAILPIPAWHHEIRWLGYVAESEGEFDAGAEFGPLLLGGTSWQSSLEYRIPLPRAFHRRLRHELVGGFDAKGADSSLEFGVLDPLRSNTETYQFQLGYEGDWSDEWGSTRFDLSLFVSPGNWSPQNEDTAYEAARTGADSSYAYLLAGVDRGFDLPLGAQLAMELKAQVASTNLLPSEQLSLSGPWAVRGFAPSEWRADSGLVLRNELRAPAFAVLGAGDQWQPFGFVDLAWGESVAPLPDEEELSLGASGLGLKAEFGRFLSADFSYGWQIAENGFDDGETGRFQGRVTVRW